MKRISASKVILAVVILFVAAVCIALVVSRPDINTEDETLLYIELIKADGIGASLAEEIISKRPYLSWSDLKDRVDGIGDKRLKILKAKFNLRL